MLEVVAKTFTPLIRFAAAKSQFSVPQSGQKRPQKNNFPPIWRSWALGIKPARGGPARRVKSRCVDAEDGGLGEVRQNRQHEQDNQHEGHDPATESQGVAENRLHVFMARRGIDQTDRDNQRQGVPHLIDADGQQ